MISDTLVELSRWQFAITAMLHFLFIPLTLGLGLLVALLESAYVLSGRAIYLALVKFWSRIFALNFVLALATRLTVVLQFGMNGSYFSHYVGDSFALPLAIEALTSFFLASALFGPYWFGWDKLGKYQHLAITWLIAIAVHVSAYWVMLANAWMQNPVGSAFNHLSYRYELINFAALLDNPIILSKFIHTVAASHVAAAAVVLAIAAYWLRSNREDAFARRSFNLAASWGLMAIIATMAVKDNTPDHDSLVQNVKRAAIGGEVNPSLQANIETRIRSGMTAFALLQDLRDDNKDPQLLANFAQHKADLGYALLLKPWSKNIVDAKDKQISLAVQSALAGYPGLLYWANRLMIACGISSVLWFALAGWQGFRRKPLSPWFPRISLYAALLPWLACVAGWFVAEAGKQPWAIAGMLPTALSISSLSEKELIVSMLGYGVAYAALLAAFGFLMKRAIQTRLVEQGARA